VEESVSFRVAVWASVSVSVLALAIQGVTSASLVAVSILLISIGSYVSWRRRHKRNIALKAAVAALSLVALASFLRQVGLQPYDLRISLAELFLWVQILHSFDLPRRRDLIFSLVSSLIIISMAGSFSLSESFAWLLLLWLATALPALYFSQQSRLGGLSNIPERAILARPTLKRVASVTALLLFLVCGTGLAVGAVMPRPSINLMRSLPFSLRRAFNPLGGFQFTNPGYPNLPYKPPEQALEVNPEAYFGFSPFLDLRARGRLLDLPVMKVKASEPAYWAGLYFREYDGVTWKTGDDDPGLLNAPTQPFDLAYDPGQAHAATHSITQTFYIQNDQPNVVFAAFRPRLVYFPSDYLYQGVSGLKRPFAPADGLVYRVVSSSSAQKHAWASLALEADGEHFAPYLELPPLPERVQGLASKLVADGGGPFSRALAIENYLRENYSYSLDVPPLPQGQDAVDFFLFDSRLGYCEHFASAYAVLCRLAGIPSRVVTGYSTGDYNPFSGLYEVSLDDAHAWVEIYLEGIGWVTREPTPDFSLPNSGTGSGSLWIFGDFLSWMGSRLSSFFPPSLRSAAKTGVRSLISAASAFISNLAYSARQAPWFPLLLLALLLSLPLLLHIRKRQRPKAFSAESVGGAVAVMRAFLVDLESLGLKREPGQTLGEFLAGLYSLAPHLDLSEELLLFERERYGLKPASSEALEKMRRRLDAGLDFLRPRLKGRRRLKKVSSKIR
jgi:transglutaminase-like putative cysteine protease